MDNPIKFPKESELDALEVFKKHLVEVEASKDTVEVSFSDATKFNLPGMQLLVALSDSLKRSGGTLKIVDIDGAQQKELSMTGLAWLAG